MEDWEIDFKYLRVQHLVKETMQRDNMPDLNAILFLIGIQELGYMPEQFSKEEKQDLMHVAVCHLLTYEGYYEFEGRDADGWPHYKMLEPFTQKGATTQAELLKKLVIHYFEELEMVNGGLDKN